MRLRGAAILILIGASLPAWGQGAAAAYDPQGVHVDARGVLRSRTTDPDPRLAELWKNAKSVQKDGRFLTVSLPRLFAEARRLLEGGKPLPPELRHLGGLTRLQYVFVHPDAKDLVIAGPAEPVDARESFRPLGRISGRPVLQLDDLVVALRAFGPGRAPDRLGCDLEITAEIRERVNAKIQAVGPTSRIIGFRKACDQIAEAGGLQPVKYFGLDPATRFAFVCVEADYRLKQLGLGLLPSPVPKVESYRSLISQPEKEFRFSLESNYDALAASPDGLAFELRGPSLKVNGGLLGHPESTVQDLSPSAKRFVTLCNENFDGLARHLVSWADLCNLDDLSVLAALVSGDDLAGKASWDLTWILDPKGCPVQAMAAPTSAAVLCNFTTSGNSALFLTGGIWIKPAEWAAKRAPDAALAGKASRPEEGWSSVRK
ncbi:MAG: DUF1598 domain-containing protein [Planctomycetes bacterium]|nr:DUF1598 domain-containing protein [Planctomycetota bacterium]